MSTLYDTSFGPGIPLGSSLVPGSASQGALNANLLTGGFLTVPTLADRDAIPVDLAEGLKLDGLSSGRRQVGMVVSVAETGERFELKIASFSTLSAADKLSALADNANWQVFATSSSPPAYSEDDDAVYCFQVGTSYNPSHFHLAKLTVMQLRRLIYDSDLYYSGYSQVSIVTDEAVGHRHTVVLTYNPSQHALEVVRVENEDGAEQVNHSAYPILADADVAKRTGGNTFVGEQTINGGSSYGSYRSDLVRLQGPDSTQFEVTPTYLEFQDGPNLVAGRVDASYDAQASVGTLKVTTGHFKVPTPREADDAATKAYVDSVVGAGGSSIPIEQNLNSNSSISVPSVAAVASILTTSVQGALAGTSGIPSATNKYLTDADPRILSAVTSGFVTAQSSVFTRFPYDGSAPVGFANAAALATATTNNDTIRYNRSYSSVNSSVNFNGLYIDGQQNYLEVISNGVLSLASCFIFDLDIAVAGTGTIQFKRGNTYMRGSTLASSTINAGCTLTLDSVRIIGAITGAGTLVLTGTCAYPSRVDSTITVKDLRGIANATSVKSLVLATSNNWANGEIQGVQPAGSQPGMRFCDATYRYEYMNGMNDTDGTSFVWVRVRKA